MFWTVLLSLSVAGASSVAAKEIQVRGTIEAGTVYRGQALVTRVIEVEGPAGSLDVVATDLPTQIVPDSLYASAEGEVEIRLVRYRTRAVAEEPRAEIRKIQEQIEDVGRELRENEANQKLQKKREDLLTRLAAFTPAITKEKNERVALDAEAIKSLTEFLFEKGSLLTKETWQLKEEAKTLKESLSVLQRKLSELTREATRTAREAVIVLEKGNKDKVKVRLNYLVRGASWSPTYNLRCKGERKQVDLEYNALVRQMSGEEWKGVQLTLSTASAAMVAEAPILTPFWVTLLTKPSLPVPGAAAVVEHQRKARGEQRQAIAQRGQVETWDEAFKQDWRANIGANYLQMLDIAAKRDILLAGQIQPTGEALSVNYLLPGKISIPSRSDHQMIQIASLKLPSGFYYQATPLLTPYVYQQADVVNTSEIALLAGPVNSYLDGQFMGGGRVPMVAKGQQFTVGFGVDSQLRAGRELADKTDEIQGGNKVLTFKYRLLAENYKDAPVKVRVLDRLPDPKGADIKVTLGELKDPLSEDKVYLRKLRKMGVLRWEIEVPAKAAGASARTVEYEYKLEFDKNMHIGQPTKAEIEKKKMEFKTLMK